MAAAGMRPLADVDRHADALVAIVLDRLDFAFADGYGQTPSLGNVAFAGAGAQALRVADDRRGKFVELSGGIGELMAACHGAL